MFRAQTESAGEMHMATASDLLDEALHVSEVCNELRDKRKIQEQKVRLVVAQKRGRKE